MADTHGPAVADAQLERRLRVLDGPVLRHHVGARSASSRAAPVRARARAEGRGTTSAQVAAQSALPVQFAEQRACVDRGRSKRRTEGGDAARANVALHADCGAGRSRLAGTRAGDRRRLSGARIAATGRAPAHRSNDRSRCSGRPHSGHAPANDRRECDQARDRRAAGGRRVADQRGTARRRAHHRSRESASPAPSRSPSSGVGLRNAAERLRLLFGTAGALDLDLSRPDRALARLRIPQGHAV